MSTEEKVINGRDLFVPEFNALLDTLPQDEKYRIVEFIFYCNIHAPRNKNSPEVMAIVLYLQELVKNVMKNMINTVSIVIAKSLKRNTECLAEPGAI